MKRDNSTFDQKVRLRRNLLRLVPKPVVLEAYGGTGKLWVTCYSHLPAGVVLEKDPEKTCILAEQRSTWAVYEADNVAALRGGAGAHLTVNLADFDAYGSPWDAIDAFFASDREWPERLGVVATDGMRQKLKLKGGWSVKVLAGAVRRYGNEALYGCYLTVCRELLEEKAALQGYRVAKWTGYHCGHGDDMTHYAAVLER